MIHRSVVEHRPVGLFLISNSLGRDQDTSLSFDERLDNLGLPPGGGYFTLGKTGMCASFG